ncbi:MAG: DUF2007 domain-containing protein [Desulfuromonadaceae bacterium]
MQKIFTPENEIELVMVKGLLEAAQIPFYVQNDHFGGLYIGPQIMHFNQRAIMVAPEHAARSKEIIAEFLASQTQAEPESSAQKEHTSGLEKLRLLAEAVLFCWIVPRKCRKKATEREHQADAEDDTKSAEKQSSRELNATSSDKKKSMED